MNIKIFKRMLVLVIAFIMVMSGGKALAYEEDDFSIDIPSTYSNNGNKLWSKSNGESISIQCQSNTRGDAATQATLNEYADLLRQGYSGSLTLEDSKITAINGYKCIYIKSKVYSMYVAQYIIPTKDKVFIITLGASSSTSLESSETQNMIKSLKIYNYQEPKTNNNNNDDDDDKNTSKNETDDDDDEDENKTSKKKNSSDDDEDNNWIIVAIIAGAAVLCVAIIGIVIAVVVSKKNKNQY